MTFYPLVAPLTPENLEQDKDTVDERFEKAFATLDQLSQGAESFKAFEERAEKLDKLITDPESLIRDTNWHLGSRKTRRSGCSMR